MVVITRFASCLRAKADRNRWPSRGSSASGGSGAVGAPSNVVSPVSPQPCSGDHSDAPLSHNGAQNKTIARRLSLPSEHFPQSDGSLADSGGAHTKLARRFSFLKDKESNSDEMVPSMLVAHTLDFSLEAAPGTEPKRPNLSQYKSFVSKRAVEDKPTMLQRLRKASGITPNFVIHPQAIWLPRWMKLVVTLLMYNIVMIPLRVSFTFDDYNGSWMEGLDIAVDCFFWADIVLHFRLGFYKRGRTRTELAQVLVLDSTAVACRYLQTWFFLDCVSAFPFDIVIEAVLSATDPAYSQSEQNSAARLTRLLRLTRLPRMLRLFRFLRARRFLTSWAQPGYIKPAVWQLLSLQLWLAVLVHIVACVLHLIHEIEESFDGGEDETYSQTWLTRLIEEDRVGNSTSSRYVAALYWSVMTLTTIGYGDVHVVTDAERLYAVFCMMLGAVAFAYLLGHAQNTLASLDNSSEEIQKRKESINAWMRYRNLDAGLQNRIRSYYSFLWSRQSIFDEGSLLRTLPAHLRKEVLVVTNRKIVQGIPFFDSADENLVSELVLKLHPVAAAAGDWLIRAGEFGSEMYIIDSGNIEIVSPNFMTVYRTLSAGEFFGEIALLTKVRRTASCRASTFCELWVLLRKDLQETFGNYPEAQEELQRYIKTPHKISNKMRYTMDPLADPEEGKASLENWSKKLIAGRKVVGALVSAARRGVCGRAPMTKVSEAEAGPSPSSPLPSSPLPSSPSPPLEGCLGNVAGTSATHPEGTTLKTMTQRASEPCSASSARSDVSESSLPSEPPSASAPSAAPSAGAAASTAPEAEHSDPATASTAPSIRDSKRDTRKRVAFQPSAMASSKVTASTAAATTLFTPASSSAAEGSTNQNLLQFAAMLSQMHEMVCAMTADEGVLTEGVEFPTLSSGQTSAHTPIAESEVELEVELTPGGREELTQEGQVQLRTNGGFNVSS